MSDTNRPLPSGIMATPGMAFAPTENPAQAQLQATLQAALNMPIPRFYVNSLGLGMTPTDLIVTFLWNGNPVCNLSVSLPLAKGMAEDLAKAVSEYERATGQTIQTAGQIGAAMQRSHAEAGTASPQPPGAT